ncbi:MAG: DUF935 domain-containing protein [Flavobacteriales bacterium]|nr:DUF935 domain-containing protein [Flavobacteriales bacterium]
MRTKRQIGFRTASLAKQGGGTNISQVLIIQPTKRDGMDISTNTQAIKSADKGKRSKLYDIYENIIKDPVIGESIRKRVRRVTNGGLTFQEDNQEVDAMADLIGSPQFRIMVREILLAKFYGKTILELDFSDGFSVHKIARKNLDTAKKVILKSLNDETGFPYEDDDFLLNVGEDDDLGLLMEAAPFAIFKRNGGSDYAEFCELWGIPILKALYDPEDENGREEMEATMEKRGAGGSIVASKNSEIDSIAAKVTGGVHKEFLEWLDEQILIGLIGQTMTTKDGSSLSQSKTHLNTEDDINDDDRTYVIEVLNHQLLPRLQKRGFPVGNGWFVYPKKDSLSLKEKIEIAEKVDDRTEDGVDEDYWFELTGIPRSKKKKTDPAKEEEDPEPEKKPAPGKTKTTKKTKVEAKELSMFEKLKDFFAHAPL